MKPLPWLRRFAALLASLILLNLTGCGVLQSLGVVPSPVPTFLRQPTPTRPLPPTSTATQPVPSATPDIPLSPQGPWLTYLSASRTGYEVVAANSDGSGPLTVGVFPDLFLPVLARPQTSGAHWFSLINGRDSTLTLFELPHGGTRKNFSLLSSDELTAEQRQVYAGILNQAATPSQAWSPDSTRLAFTAAMDGGFTDMYLFDTRTDSLLRLTEKIGESYYPLWSSDGSAVLVQEINRQGAGSATVNAVYWLAADGSDLKALYRPKSLSEQIFGWISADTFLVASRRQAGLVELRRYSLEKAQHALLSFSGPFDHAVFSPQKAVLAFITAAPDKNVASLQQGLYWTSPSTGAVPVASGKWQRLEWSESAGRFFASSSGLVLSFAPGQEKVRFENEENLPVSSSDGKWLAFYGGENSTRPGLRLVSPDGKTTRDITADPIQEVLWRQDNSGLFYVSNGTLYFYALQDEQARRLQNGVSNIDWVGRP